MASNYQETEKPLRPKQVSSAVYLIYASIAVSAIFLVLGILSSYQTGVEFSTTLSILTCSGVIYIVMIFINTRVANGRNWARTLTLILFILGVLGIICDYRSSIGNPLNIAHTVTTSLLQLTAVILLYVQPSNTWFKSTSKQNKQESQGNE